jgi:hypothetical protein
MNTPRTLADCWKTSHLDFLVNLAHSLAGHATAASDVTEFLDALPALNHFCRESELLDKELQLFLSQDIDQPDAWPPGTSLPILLALRRLHSVLKPLKAERKRDFKWQWKRNWEFSPEWEYERLRSLRPDVARLKEAADKLRCLVDDHILQEVQQASGTNAGGLMLPMHSPSDTPKPTGNVWRGTVEMREVESQEPDSTRPKRALTVEEANEKAKKMAKADRSFVHRTQRQWAQALGCSVGLVAKLPLWKLTMKHAGRGKGEKKPKAVLLSEEGLSMLGEGSRDEVLQQLIDEQQRDDKRRKVHKRL